jgi:hypothetical protein
MQSPNQDRKWIWIARGALIVYCLLAGILIMQRPGLYYDEALTAVGSVHMRHSSAELTLPHDPDTWLCARGHCFPLMTMRYIGAIKEYVYLPTFALFGTRTEVIRVVSVLFSLLCIWGVGKLIGEQISRPVAACAALAIAINPAFLTTTVFDNGAVTVMMAAFGLVCLALSSYVRRSSARAAFWVGAAMGFGVWSRANFVWLMISIVAAAVIVLRRSLLAPLSHWLTWIGGGVLGGLPFLVYQVYSNGGTWEATNMFIAREPLVDRLFTRLVLFSETLLTDREHRAMWDGPAMPDWQRWLFLALVLLSLGVCLTMSRWWRGARSLWAQGAGLTFLFLALFLFFSKTPIAEHHLIALVPLAVIVVVLACGTLRSKFRWGRAVSFAVAAVYVGSVAFWQFAAIQGLHRTRGAGAWSDGVYTLARQLPQKYGAQEVKILDWGLENNLYILTDARLHTREIYSDGAHAQWPDEIRRGGVFLLNGPENRQFPEASEAFLKAVAETRPAVQRFTVPQRSGVPFAEVIEIQPDSIGQASSLELTHVSRPPEKLEGFYPPEPGGFRWTKRDFALTFAGPGPARLVLQLYISDASIQKLGAVTMTARLGVHLLAPETFRKSGGYTFERDIPAAWMKPEGNRFNFALDKALAPTAQDGRELGIVLVSAALGPK